MSYKVLVVDDEAPIRDLFTEIFKQEKASVDCVGSGEEALEIVQKNDYDVVMLDIKLPGISGIETLKRIRDLKPNQIVIMLTGFGYDEELISKSKEFGCAGYIGKNMPISQILSNFKLFFNNMRAKQQKG